MKDDILTHLNDPGQLEKIYRTNKGSFKRAFSTLYPTLKGNTLADFWNERLAYENDEINWGTSRELSFVLIACLLAGLIAKLPGFLDMDKEFFYSRNIGFIVLPLLSVYFAWKNKLSTSQLVSVVGLILLSLLFINFLPDARKSDTVILSCLHLPLFLWSIMGYTFVGEVKNNVEKRLGYLKYNGDLVVITTLILISGAIMTAITIGLFSLIGFQIEKLYFNYVGIFGLASAPIVGTYLTQTNPQLVGRVSPVIAKLFSPLVLVMLIIYLLAIIYSGKNPYNNREFLLMFNGLLVGVMAIIFFSVAETFKATKSRAEIWVLFLLSLVTIVVNGIALSAILFRISEWGITPNKAAVLGGNILILVNLLLVATHFYRVLFRKTDIADVGRSIAAYLPVYCFWTAIVAFLFPLLFGIS